MRFSAFIVLSLFCSVRLCPSPVAVRLHYARACSKRSSLSRAAFRRTAIYEPSAPPRGAFCLTPQGILLCSLVGRASPLVLHGHACVLWRGALDYPGALA